MPIKHNFTVKMYHSLCAGQQTGKKSTELFAFPWMMYKTHRLHKWTHNFTKQHEFFLILSSYPGKNIPKRKLNLTLHHAIDISGSYQQDKRRENEKQHMHYFITQVWGFLSKIGLWITRKTHSVEKKMFELNITPLTPNFVQIQQLL